MIAQAYTDMRHLDIEVLTYQNVRGRKAGWSYGKF